MGKLFSTLTETEIRDECRHKIDTFENWSRRLIDELFRDKYSKDYFDFEIAENQPLIKNEIKQRIEQRMADDPERFPRKVDAIVIEDIKYFLCRDDLYDRDFKNILEPFFSGKEEVRSVLDRLIPIRNKLSHGNTISCHEAEQCLCYTNDFIKVFKHYYTALGKERDYNVPTFMRVKDYFGNDVVLDPNRDGFINPLKLKVQLRSGDEYKLWVEVDSSFDCSLYEIHWIVKYSLSDIIEKGNGNVIQFSVANKHVSYSPEINIFLITSKEWHRHGHFDDIIIIHLEEVLPPIEDLY